MDQPPGGLLALDIATVTGFAYGPVPNAPPPTALEVASGAPAPKPWSGIHRMAPPGASVADVMLGFDRFATELIALAKPRVLVFEAPLLKTGNSNITTARKLLGMAAWCEALAKRAGVGMIREAHNQTVKRHFAAHGRATKEQIIAECRGRGWEVCDDNEADALALWDYGAYCLTARRRAA